MSRIETSDETARLSISLAGHQDREQIYRLRHQIYAVELGQHPLNQTNSLSDDLDSFNHYLVVKRGHKIVGFISVTPQHSPRFSVYKYVERGQVSAMEDKPFFELRILTVIESERRGLAAALLMHGAIRWLQENQAQRVVAIGRKEVLGLYSRLGFETLGVGFTSGKVQFELMFIDRSEMDSSLRALTRTSEAMKRRVIWNLDFPFSEDESCFHGGASIELMGSHFEDIEAQPNVINADVLDAWFPPCPEALRKMNAHLGWLSRTSPPTQPRNLRCEIARRRGVAAESIVVGAGSSDLIYRACLQWLDSDSKVLLVAPCYGEYEFILRNVLHCRVEVLKLNRDADYRLSLHEYQTHMRNGCDFVVVVNPNNPTGALIDQETWHDLLDSTPPETKLWIDECYIDYVEGSQSMESVAALRSNLIVCKSLSKTFGLSGLRVGYLCLSPELAEGIRKVTPPWVVGLLGQIAAMEALGDPEYYAQQYRRTNEQRRWLEAEVGKLGFDVHPGCANFFVAWLSEEMVSKDEFLSQCKEQRLFLRDIFRTSPSLGSRAIRFAVKDESVNQRMVEIMGRILSRASGENLIG